jgi:uncharacterized membrane protein
MKTLTLAFVCAFWGAVAGAGAAWIVGGHWQEWAALAWIALVGVVLIRAIIAAAITERSRREARAKELLIEAVREANSGGKP